MLESIQLSYLKLVPNSEIFLLRILYFSEVIFMKTVNRTRYVLMSDLMILDVLGIATDNSFSHSVISYSDDFKYLMAQSTICSTIKKCLKIPQRRNLNWKYGDYSGSSDNSTDFLL